LTFHHFDGTDEGNNLSHHLDIMLVLHSISDGPWLRYYGRETISEYIASDNRTMHILGLLEPIHALDQGRDFDTIQEDWSYKYVQ
jgi:hypothetical protein